MCDPPPNETIKWLAPNPSLWSNRQSGLIVSFGAYLLPDLEKSGLIGSVVHSPVCDVRPFELDNPLWTLLHVVVQAPNHPKKESIHYS